MAGPALFGSVRPATVIGAGLTLAAAGFAVVAQAGGLEWVIAGSVLFSLGLSPVAGLSTELVVGSAPPERAGAASGMSETSAELGGALGIAVLGSIGTAVYRSQIAIPAGVPQTAGEAARDTPGGGAAAGEELPLQLASELLDAVRDAFTEALQTAALTSAVLAAGAAAVAYVLLRGERNPGATA